MKLIFFILTLLIANLYVYSKNIEQSWKSGETTVTLKNGTLRISGKGAMEDYDYETKFPPWFNSKYLITGLVIEDGVTHIGNTAFSSCSGLMSVTIPNSVISIGDEAFPGLLSIEVVAGNTGYSSEDGILFNKDKTTLIQYPPNGQDTYVIPVSVMSIGNRAFALCTGLTSVTIPNGVISIGEKTFYFCKGLTSVTIPSSVKHIGDWAFSWCTGLTFAEIHSGVTSIGDAAFTQCTSLTSITIPNSVTSIGDAAFENCVSLTSVTIGSGITSIERAAFKDCPALTSIIIQNPTPPKVGYSTFYAIGDNACLYVPKSSVNTYIWDYGQWGGFNCIKPIESYGITKSRNVGVWLTLGILSALLLLSVIFVIVRKSRKVRQSTGHITE